MTSTTTQVTETVGRRWVVGALRPGDDGSPLLPAARNAGIHERDADAAVEHDAINGPSYRLKNPLTAIENVA